MPVTEGLSSPEGSVDEWVQGTQCRPGGRLGSCCFDVLPVFVWHDGEQMWKGRRSGTVPEQLEEIKNNSIPGDWGNYRARESEQARVKEGERGREGRRGIREHIW